MKKQKMLSNSEIASFCKQTAWILKAGITPAEGMEILINDTISKEGKELLQQIRMICNKGNHFYTALEETGVFPQYVVKLTALGEESGNLDVVLMSLAEYYEREETITDSIRSAVTYPLIMIAMMFFVIIILIVKVLPIFKQVFVQLGTEMTTFAQSLMNAGTVLSRYAIGISIVLLFLAAALFIAYRIPSGKAKIRHFLTVFPFTKSFYDKIAAGRFARGMYLSYQSGMDTYHSLDMIKEIVENEEMAKKIERCKAQMQGQADLPEALASAEIFSNLYSRMVSVGFRSGSMDVVMLQIASHYEEETDRQLSRIVSIIEPTLVIILSLIVGVILLSVLLPLMGIMASIG